MSILLYDFMLISVNFNQLDVYLRCSMKSNASETLTRQYIFLLWTFCVKDVTKVV